MTESHIDLLRNADFLADSGDRLLARIGRDARVVELPAGTEIFADGARGEAMYFIAEGEVRLVKQGEELLTLPRGGYLGEMALIDDDPRSAGAVAATDVVLLRWHKDDFLASVRGDGEVAYRVCRALSTKIRHNVDRIARFQQDLRRAAQVQRALLPEPTFHHPMIDLCVYCLQADNVGGDYYDYLASGEDRIALAVVDAQGHGFYAALLVAMLKTGMHSQAIRDPEPSLVMRAANRSILENLSQILTATCCCVLLDRTTHTLRFCSAGHIPQYHCRASGEIEKLESANPLLGLPGHEDLEFRSQEREWTPGDLLVLFTDGLTEAENHRQEEFGDDRVHALLTGHHHRPPAEVQQHLRQGLDRHRGDTPLHDDVTIVVARLS